MMNLEEEERLTSSIRQKIKELRQLKESYNRKVQDADSYFEEELKHTSEQKIHITIDLASTILRALNGVVPADEAASALRSILTEDDSFDWDKEDSYVQGGLTSSSSSDKGIGISMSQVRWDLLVDNLEAEQGDFSVPL